MDVETAEVVARFRELESSNIDAIVAPGAEEEAVAILRRTRRRMVLYTVAALGPLPARQREREAGAGRAAVPAGQHRAHRPGGVANGHARPAHAGAAARNGGRLAADAAHPAPTPSWCGTRPRGGDAGHRQRAGEPRRLGAHCAGAGGRESARGAILASDSFFPFQDCVELAASCGICGNRAAGRLHKRSGIDRRRGCRGPCDGSHRRAAPSGTRRFPQSVQHERSEWRATVFPPKAGIQRPEGRGGPLPCTLPLTSSG